LDIRQRIREEFFVCWAEVAETFLAVGSDIKAMLGTVTVAGIFYFAISAIFGKAVALVVSKA
jgi:hypothetical protein